MHTVVDIQCQKETEQQQRKGKKCKISKIQIHLNQNHTSFMRTRLRFHRINETVVGFS